MKEKQVTWEIVKKCAEFAVVVIPLVISFADGLMTSEKTVCGKGCA